MRLRVHGGPHPRQRIVEGGLLRNAETDLDRRRRCGIDAEVPELLSPHAAVGHDDLHFVAGHDLGPKQGQVPDRARNAADLHFMADPERPEDQQHDARGQVRQRALERQADSQGGGAEHRSKARRLNAEFGQHRQHGDGQHEIAGGAAEEALQHFVHMRGPPQHPEHDLMGFARKPQADQEDDDCAQHAQAIRDGQRQQGVKLRDKVLGVLSRHGVLLLWREQGHL